MALALSPKKARTAMPRVRGPGSGIRAAPERAGARRVVVREPPLCAQAMQRCLVDVRGSCAPSTKSEECRHKKKQSGACL